MTPKKTATNVPVPLRGVSRGRTTRQYQKLAVTFLVLSIAIVGLITYLSLAKTLIRITPANMRYPVSFSVRVQDELPAESSSIIIRGSIIQATVRDSLTYSGITTKETVDGTARGTVKIYNNWSENQPLIETTRLLSPSGILFRLEQGVNVPAGGSVQDVPVYADQPGGAGDIQPTRFTIPGLWKGLQDQIYAESSEPMTGGVRDAKVLTAENVRSAKAQLAEQMAPKALDALVKEASTAGVFSDLGDIVIISQQLLSEELSAKEGDTVETVTITQDQRYLAALFDKDILTDLVATQAEKILPIGLEITEIDPDSVVISSGTYNAAGRYAEVQVTADALAIVRLSNSIFDRKNLTSKDTYEIQTYFSGFDEVESVEIRFSPFWLRKTSALPDHIEIRLAELPDSLPTGTTNTNTSNANQE